MIHLRTDIHRVWDDKRLVSFPKGSGDRLRLYAYATNRELYHGRTLYGVSPATIESFFARFAYSIFPLASFIAHQGITSAVYAMTEGEGSVCVLSPPKAVPIPRQQWKIDAVSLWRSRILPMLSTFCVVP